MRRALCRGIVVGVAGAALLALLEVGWLAIAARAALAFGAGRPATPTGPWEGAPVGSVFLGAARFGLPLAGLAIAGGALAGLVQGGLVAALARAAAALGRSARGERRWFAALAAGVATPGIAWLAARMFAGAGAQRLPAREEVIAGVGTAGIAVAYGAAWLARGAGWRGRAALGAAVGLVAVAAGAVAVDHLVWVRRYPAAHGAMEAVAFVALELAVLAAARADAGRRWAWSATPAWALLVVGAAGVAGALGLVRFRAVEAGALRALAHEEGGVADRLLDGVRALGLSAADRPTRDPHGRPLAGGPSPAFAGSGHEDPSARQGPLATSGRSGARLEGHARGSDTSEILEADAPRRPGADILLVTVDALRADHMGAYGYARPTTPRLDALAAESVVFERAYAPIPHTSFSIASLLVGKHMFALAQLGLAAGHETLADALKLYGWKTAAFYPPAVFTVDGGRLAGYEARHYGFEYARYEPFLETEDAPRRTDQVLAFLAAERPARALVWVHYFGPHEPYVAHDGLPAFGAGAADRYDGEILWVDGEIGRLVDDVRRARPGTIVVVTADHGEEFGEHGGAYHGTTLYEEQVRVPLIVSVPGVPARRVRAPVSTIDVAPTLLGLVDVPVSARVRGVDLGPWLAAARPAPERLLPPVFAELDSLKLVAAGDDRLLCDVTRGYCRLYRLDGDPGERVDAMRDAPARAAELDALLDAWLVAQGARESDGGGPARAALQRGRLGDRDALPGLAELLAAGDATPADRLEAVRAIGRIVMSDGCGTCPPAGEGLSRALTEVAAGHDVGRDATLRAWAQIALSALGDRSYARDLRVLAAAAGDPELGARAALSLSGLDAAPLQAAALQRLVAPPTTTGNAGAAREAGSDVIALAERLVDALGAARDRRGLAPLHTAFAQIPLRPKIVRALGAIGDPAELPFLARLLADERYPGVRAEAALALGALHDRRALPLLRAALGEDPEASVRAAAATALARLGEVSPPPARPR